MHPIDSDIVATCRRDDAHRVAARHRGMHPADHSAAHPGSPLLALRRRLGQRLVAWGHRLQAPRATPATPGRAA